MYSIPLLLVGCGSAVPPEPAPPPVRELPPTANEAAYRDMAADLAAPRHPSDGGGRVELVEGPEAPVVAGTPGRWVVELEVGERGIAVGGAITFQSPPFWNWSEPQLDDPVLPGFTLVSTTAEGVDLDAGMFGQGMLRVAIGGRPLRPGERVRFEYGAGEVGAYADRYAERGQRLWVSVDGDGDGVRRIVPGCPMVEVAAGPPQRLVLTLPSVAHPGGAVRLTVAALDGYGNLAAAASGPVPIAGPPELGLPPTAELSAGTAALVARPTAPGIYTVVAGGEGLPSGASNPMLVQEGAQEVLWADLQIHTGLSDGTGLPEDAYRYARDVAGLDVAAVTDHDHWGMEFLDQHPALYDQVVRAARDAYQPGVFVTAVGFEWTSWIHGHRHVLYFADQGPLLSSMDPATDDPAELWAALRGLDAITVAHHSAGGPVAIDWSFRPDPELEPITEIVSVHGQSESPDGPGVIYSAVAGNFVRDQLAGGVRLGLLGSSDGHDGHPGLGQLNAPSGGLAGIVTSDRTREGVLAALRARRVFATNGPRILLRFSVQGVPMGGVLPTGAGPVTAVVRVVGTAPVDGVELIRGAEVVEVVRGDGTPSLFHAFELADPKPGELAYVRVRQVDGGVAWSSPVFFDPPGPASGPPGEALTAPPP